MKIFRNIIPFAKLFYSLKYLTEYNKEISKARKAGDFEREREFILKSTTLWGNHIIKTFDIDLTVTGKENLPDKGPVVFVGNHPGYADIPVTCVALDKFQFAYVAKNVLSKIPFYGEWIKQIRGVFIEREDTRSSLRAISEGIELIEQGFSLFVFPEGTRSKSYDVAEFKKGSLRLATKPEVPIIPITLYGTHLVWEEQLYLKKGASVEIIIHPPIETKGMSKAESNNLMAEVKEIILSGLEGKDQPK